MARGDKPMRERIRYFLLLLALLAAPGLAADTGTEQAPGPAAAAAPAAAAIGSEAYLAAPVVVDGVTLFRVRGISSYPAATRAREIAAKIIAIARDRSVPPSAVEVKEVPLGSAIVAGSRQVMIVLDADARLEATERPVLADAYRQLIARAVVRYRSDRETGARITALAYTLGALGALAAVLYGVLRLHRGIYAAMERRYHARVEDLQIKGFKVFHAEHLWSGVRSVVGGVHVAIALVCIYVALHFALFQFPETREFAADLRAAIVGPLATMGSGFIAAVPKLVFLAILVLVTRYALTTLQLFFGAIERGSVKMAGFDPEWSWPTYRIVRLLVIAFALVVAYPYIPGSQSEAFKGISLFLGVIISLGSSSIIGNIIAGYSMTYRRAFRVGDRIKVGEVVGDVTEVRLQVTHVRTPKNEEVVIPNSVILGSHVINYSTLADADGLILHTTVGIGYETPWRQVEAMLLAAAARTAGVKAQPAPFVLQTALGDFAITYELNAYCEQPNAMPAIYSALHRNILDVFNEYGVAIMTPAYVADPEAPKLVAKKDWYAAPAQPPQADPQGAA
jgi:small-conductance mechanosensitive channel